MVKLAKAHKNQGDPKKMAPPPKEVEDDSEDEDMSDDEEESSGEEEVEDDSEDEDMSDDEEDDDDDEDDDSEEEAMEVTPAKGKKAPAKAVPVKAKSMAEEEDDDEEEEDDEEDEDEEEEEDDEEEEEEAEPVKEVSGKRKKEMAKQKSAPEAKKQKVEAVEPTTAFNLFIGNLNCNKSAPELKTGLNDLFVKNDLTVMDVRIGTTRKFGYVDFASADDLEKALELTGLKVFGNEIKLERPKGKDHKYAFIEFASFEDAKEALSSCNKREIEGRAIRLELQGARGSPNARSQPSKTLFVKGLSEETTEETLKESFDGSVRARIVTDRETGSSKGFGFVDFNSEEDAKAAKEAMEDGEIDGNKVTLDWAKPKGEGGFGGRGGGRGGFGGRGGHGRGGRGGFGGRGRGGFGGRGGFRGGRGGGGDHKPQGKKTKFE
ncbi:LOW QUALITY PROTEIN: nucleolin [Echinops telfairi]|uniref:LOW QUALITY PROTEIN: nucleolin n=1 Tax=Echinops telfairi TaxID=9371 RepID=A0ABM0ZQ58_ECHTE|nr:LOW QUALITY PROTEIN: nucleolin [Echinops telfairi]